VISNVFLMFLNWQQKSSSRSAAQNGLEADWVHIARTRKKLTSMRTRRQTKEMQGIVAQPLDLKATGNKLAGTAGGGQVKVANHWFRKPGDDREEAIAARLEPSSANTLPTPPPLPSSEDSFLAFNSDDELFFDPPARERWRELSDDKTAVVPVLRQGEKSYSFAGEALFA
jgi:hypothetical protein